MTGNIRKQVVKQMGTLHDRKILRGYLPTRPSVGREGILKTLAAFCGQNKKGYCSTSQEVLLKQLKKFYKFSLHLRMLNYHLKYLERYGWIRRIRRLSRSPRGELVTLTTLYIITEKCMRYLKGMYKFGRRIATWFSDIPRQVIVGEKLAEARRKSSDKKTPKPMPEYVKRILNESLHFGL
jgi:hypothetical protein